MCIQPTSTASSQTYHLGRNGWYCVRLCSLKSGAAERPVVVTGVVCTLSLNGLNHRLRTSSKK
eukprot:12623006-Prorocentrum_lima.AAC.1